MPSAQKRTHHPLIDIDIRRLLVLKQGPLLIMLLFKPPSYIHLFLLPDARETQPVGSQALLGLGLGSCGGDRFIRGTLTSPQSSSAASRTPSPADSVSLRSGCSPAAVRLRSGCGPAAASLRSLRRDTRAGARSAGPALRLGPPPVQSGGSDRGLQGDGGSSH